MIKLVTLEQMMELADTLFGLSEDRVIHRARHDFSDGEVELLSMVVERDRGAAKEGMFNMTFVHASVVECGTVCCAIGWGRLLFGLALDTSGFPEAWLFSGLWSRLIASGGDSAKAAAHRIWHWIALECGVDTWIARGGGFMSDASWSQFVSEHPLDECRRRAQEYVRSFVEGDGDGDGN